MPFTTFAFNTTISSSEMNDNFFHIAQGHFLPMAGTNLSVTATEPDLGSQSYRWRTMHYSGSIISDSGDLWRLVTKFDISTNTTVDVTGLNGDRDKEYKIITNSGWGADLQMYINVTDGSITFYGINSSVRQYCQVNDEVYIMAKSSYPKILQCKWLNNLNDFVCNDTNTLTSMTFKMTASASYLSAITVIIYARN